MVGYAKTGQDAFKVDLPQHIGGIQRGPLDERAIESGERNDELTRWAGKWASEGNDIDTVIKLTMGHNVLHCREPLPQKDTEVIACSVFKREPEKLAELGIDPGKEILVSLIIG
ncbi:primase C-terminal domain-containing protein [Fundidesulfovibrio putealis]|uniref:primase C-terminal domain-containing protein n=1 Tax=Fundidesulfovibrio putealis TaxID=270496 RepID=UPI000A020C65|nr:primase C-terminal domain-containing protein [Fundidesulfovibrio putealis]